MVYDTTRCSTTGIQAGRALGAIPRCEAPVKVARGHSPEEQTVRSAQLCQH